MAAAVKIPPGGFGLLRRDDRAVYHVTGADRVAYLHRMLTQDVAGLAEGRGTYACVLTPRGRILSDLLLWHLGDRFAMDLPRAGASKAIPHLERYVIADDVAFADVTPATARFTLVGTRTSDLGAQAPGAIEVRRSGGLAARCLRWDLGQRPALEGLCAAEDARSGSALLGLLAGTVPIERAEYERARVEEGVPAFGHELGEDVIPNEALLESALSWSKGCYPGQEPVVMAKHRGHPPNVLVRLEIVADDVPAGGAALLHEGRAVGRITSAVRADRRILGLGYVRHAHARPGTDLSIQAGGTARLLA